MKRICFSPALYGTKSAILNLILQCNYVRDQVTHCIVQVTLETFGDTNVERKRCTYDVNLTWFESADWTSTSKRRQSDVIRAAFAFYVFVTR